MALKHIFPESLYCFNLCCEKCVQPSDWKFSKISKNCTKQKHIIIITVQTFQLNEHVNANKPRERNYLSLLREPQHSVGYFLIPLVPMVTEVRSAEVGTNGKQGPRR